MPKTKKKDVIRGVKQTPMLRQYLDLKEQYPDCILFFRLGDFYEMFFQDAQIASELLDLTLTSRSKGEDAYPMCGVPHFSAQSYVARLVENGHKVAICDQVEDAKLTKGIVKREVTRVVSPGMITDPEDLDARQANYLAGLSGNADDDQIGLAFLDVSTADFRLTQVAGMASLFDEIGRIRPREILIPRKTSFEALGESLSTRFQDLFIKLTDPTEAAPKNSHDVFENHFDLAEIDKKHQEVALSAARLVFNYASASLPGSLDHIRRLVPYRISDHLIIDDFSQVNLELTRTAMDGKRHGSLLAAIDRTKSPMGARMLASWLLYPLLSTELIEIRQAAVGQMVDDSVLRSDTRGILVTIRDLERLMSKMAVGQPNPRDLASMRDSLARLPDIKKLLENHGAKKPINILLGDLDPLIDVYVDLSNTLSEDPPADILAGGGIKSGFDPRLDEIVSLAKNGRDRIAGLEIAERAKTGIQSLKIKYNRVFGYYIEVTKANLKLVPDEYRRKQTTANAERYETDQLKILEERILNAQQERRELEEALFQALIARLVAQAERIYKVAGQIATCDVIASLAELAVAQGYCRPQVDEGWVLSIKECRHPVVEQMMKKERFVPNDVEISCDEKQLLIITGPNMAGKSTVIRQVALVCILAQMGSYVPASSARVGRVDRIFTRIGAADNLARGQSTFMVEMTETAHILNNATRRSLLILDEIGRGTSTFDGLSIAWSIAEFIHDRIGARTLFATHYHQLSELAVTKKRTANFTISVKEWNDKIIFLRRLIAGTSNRSYGIQVGSLAGLPEEVTQRAKEVLANLEHQEFDEIGAPKLSLSKNDEQHGIAQLQLFQRPVRSQMEKELSLMDLDSTTPIEALNLLSRWKDESIP
jgi:DNA mismatch repair protein MutS